MSSTSLLVVFIQFLGILVFADPTIVTTQYGPIQGTAHGSVISFQSVPFAKPPVGDLRWTMPQPPDAWTSVLPCNKDPVRCVQPTDNGMSEDCLYLNVFVPTTCNGSCASMTWIHGGSYFTGYAGGEGFNGTYMAELTGVIVVSLNYRLGAIGFLWNPQLDLFGNYGHMDQAFGIEWVYNNIEAFGGDREQVYIYGESAGATSVSLHVANTSMSHIIKGAIAESIPFGVPLRFNKTWGNMPYQFEDVMGCSRKSHPNATERLKCLRSVTDFERILVAQDEAIGANTARYPWLFWPNFMPWTPTVDPSENGLIKKQPFYSFLNGEILDIPLIIGTNENESNVIWDPIPTECFEVSVELDDLFGPIKAAKIRDKYDIPTGLEDCRNQSKGFQTDSIFRCGSRNMTANAAKYNAQKNVYWYHFDRVPSWCSNPHCCQPDGGVCHGAELSFVFGSTQTPFTAQEMQLSEMMRWYWGSFVKTGGDVNKYANVTNSNNSLFVPWTRYQAGHQSTMLLNTGTLNLEAPYEDDVDYCDFWDNEIGYDWINRL